MHLSSTNISTPLTLASALVSCILSSCAILTVDVDVYKGPLMNEESVQMLQLLALAEGAQPILTHLRDSLEWSYDGKLPDILKNYSAGYIDDSTNSKKKISVIDCSLRQTLFTSCKKDEEGFKNTLARRVNDVLAGIRIFQVPLMRRKM